MERYFKEGIIPQRISPKAMDETDVYELTHEIFAIYDPEPDKKIDFFSDNDKIYVINSLKELTVRYLSTGNLDLVAELTTCMFFFKMQSDPVFKRAVSTLCNSQNRDGSFGDYEKWRPVYLDRVKELAYLHTTEAVLKTLSYIFKDTEYDRHH
jgi:hypothetical protein